MGEGDWQHCDCADAREHLVRDGAARVGSSAHSCDQRTQGDAGGVPPHHHPCGPEHAEGAVGSVGVDDLGPTRRVGTPAGVRVVLSEGDAREFVAGGIRCHAGEQITDLLLRYAHVESPARVGVGTQGASVDLGDGEHDALGGLLVAVCAPCSPHRLPRAHGDPVDLPQRIVLARDHQGRGPHSLVGAVEMPSSV